MNMLCVTRSHCFAVILFALQFSAGAALAEVKPATLFSDHMVLQSGMSVPIWGTASPGEQVTVTLTGQKRTAATSAAGKWMVRLTNLQAGGPFEMTIAGKNTITIQDVLVGEVWIGSGQSNMGFALSTVLHAEQEIAAANYPKIRMFTGRARGNYEPQSSVEGQWQVCTPEFKGLPAASQSSGRRIGS